MNKWEQGNFNKKAQQGQTWYCRSPLGRQQAEHKAQWRPSHGEQCIKCLHIREREGIQGNHEQSVKVCQFSLQISLAAS